jgi:hypothetical protein
MRIFHVVAYEAYVATGQSVYSSPSLSELFGSVDRLYVGGYTSEVSGSLPTLEIVEDISLDNENWHGGNYLVGSAGTPFPLNLGTETKFQGADLDPDIQLFGAKAPFRRLKITLGGGANTNAMLRLWATGRDGSRRAMGLARMG